MDNKDEKRILQIIKFTPPIFIISLSIIICFAIYLNHKKTFFEEKEKIKSEFIELNKKLIKAQTQRVHKFILSKQAKTEEKLKESLKSRVHEAYNIAMNIYKENNHLDEKIVKKMIKDALRTIRFNNGRGYFFIYSFDYECILLPIANHLEGSSFYNFKDGKGNYLTRNIISQVKKEKEGFLTWWYHKPSDMKNQYKKLGFNKHFEPFDWFIGTGEYFEDFENDIKKEVLAHIHQLRYRNNGYIFVLDYKGNYLNHIRKEIIGLNALEAKDTRSHKVIQDTINLAKNNGSGYTTYIQNKKPGSDLPTKKTSYVMGIDSWQWFVGNGFYEDDIQDLIQKEEATLNRRLKENLNNIFITTFILTIVLLFISIYISKFLERRFKVYKEEITKQQYVLSQQSKMAAIGTMIGNIAHQWRQPLSIISTAATGILLKKDLKTLEDDDLENSLESINKSTQYLSKTIDDFRNFFLTNKEKTDFKINEAIKKTLDLTSARFKNQNIKIIDNSEEVEIYGIESELIQVLINILNNARDELIKKDDSLDRLIIIDTKTTTNNIDILVKDNAGGIKEEILEHVFEPYFTTKHQSQGTGIGLYMSQEIIVKHLNGSIQMDNITFTYNEKEEKGVQIKISFERIK